MSGGGFADDALANPVAVHIAKLSSLDLDALSETEVWELHDDVVRLQMAARGRMLPGAADVLRLVRDIRQHLDAAETAACEFPKALALRSVEPSGREVSEIISEAKSLLFHKLRLAEKVAGSELEKFPTKTKKPDYSGRFTALSAARIYYRRTRDFPKKGKPKGLGVWSSGYFNFLDAVLSELGLGKDCSKWGGWAVDQFKREQAKSVNPGPQ